MKQAIIKLALMLACAPVLAEVPEICQSLPPAIAAMKRTDTLDGADSYTYSTQGDKPLRLHVFSPEHAKNAAAIVIYFGGGWVWGTVQQFVPQAQYLAQRGMVVVLVNYRVKCLDDSDPFDSLADARASMAWVRSHAAKLGIDSHRIAAGGESAGAHLALSLAVFGTDKIVKPNALVLFSAPIDITTNDAWIRSTFGDSVADRIADISPMQHEPQQLPPTVVFEGLEDTDTPYENAKRWCEIARSHGNDCRVLGYAGAKHGFSNYPGFPAHNSLGGKWYVDTLKQMDRFLVSVGYLKAQP